MIVPTLTPSLSYVPNGPIGYAQIQGFKQGFGSAPLILGPGNIGIGTTTPGYPLQVAGNCAPTAFITTSDRNAKEHFQSVSPREVLAKVVTPPVSRWNYKEDQTQQHIDPMAQDFHAAFNVGPDDRHIATMDEKGVALTAIQGLNQKLEATEKTVREKDVEVQDLKARLEKLERLINAKIEEHR